MKKGTDYPGTHCGQGRKEKEKTEIFRKFLTKKSEGM